MVTPSSCLGRLGRRCEGSSRLTELESRACESPGFADMGFSNAEEHPLKAKLILKNLVFYG